MRGQASHFESILGVKGAFFYRTSLFILKLAAFRWFILGIFDICANAGLRSGSADFEGLLGVRHWLLRLDVIGAVVMAAVVGAGVRGCDFFCEFILYVEFKEVVDEVLVDVL